MPFVDRSTAIDPRGGVADALAHDIITRLAKLRSLFVIAQGTVFALHERRIGPEEAGRMLNVDYVVGGSVRREGTRLTVTVELVETRTARIVWAEIFNHQLDDALLILDEMGNSIVASIASEIETIERNRAILRPPSSLDAWEAHHRGLWHMYRFNKPDNTRAQHFFKRAVHLDPTFARALRRPVVHAFSERISGLGEARARSRSGFRNGRTKLDGRRSRPRRALGHGPSALAAR
jgi:TolB-like protein